MVRLVPMPAGEFERWQAAQVRRYAEENVTAGDLLFAIKEAEHGQKVGTIWLWLDRASARPAGFIYDLFVEESCSAPPPWRPRWSSQPGLPGRPQQAAGPQRMRRAREAALGAGHAGGDAA